MLKASARPPAVPVVIDVALVPLEPGAALSAVVDVRIAPLPAAVDPAVLPAAQRFNARAEFLASLPTLSAVALSRGYKPLPKGKTRIESFVDVRPLVKMNEKTFRREVWTRDKYACRACERQGRHALRGLPGRPGRYRRPSSRGVSRED
jgi:hypothetical protein